MWQRVVLYGTMALKYTTMLNRKAWQAQAFERLHDIKISSAVEESKEVLLPPKKKTQPQSKESYAAACKRRSRCSHKKEEDNVLKPAVIRYGNAYGSFMRCPLCKRRWKWDTPTEDWVIHDEDAPKNKNAAEDTSSRKSRPSSSRSSHSSVRRPTAPAPECRMDEDDSSSSQYEILSGEDQEQPDFRGEW